MFDNSYFQIIVLSFIQGLTEFLPVSSSGHLIIAPKLFGWQDQGLEMDVAVHMGTLLSVLIYFRKDILCMIQETLGYVFSGFNKDQMGEYARLSLIIILATIPAVCAGFVLKKLGIDLVRHVWIVATTSIVFGILMLWADRRSQDYQLDQFRYGNGFFVGLAQALALIPGTSRSGACITAARLMGFSRTSAARFAFLLSIPAILGAGVLTTLDALKAGQPILTQEFLLAITTSFMFGILAIHFMLTFLNRYGLGLFAVYRLALGGVLLVYFV